MMAWLRGVDGREHGVDLPDAEHFGQVQPDAGRLKQLRGIGVEKVLRVEKAAE